MADDGNGVFSLPSAAFVNGTTASATTVNANFSDIAAALTARVTRDGSGAMSGALAMGSNRITGLSTGTARTDAATVAQVQDSAPMWGGTAGGTADALTLTLTPAIASYTTGLTVRFIVGGSVNTGAATLAINGLTATAIRIGLAASALSPGDLPAGALAEVTYDGTVFRLTQVQPAGVGIALIRAANAADARTLLDAADITGDTFTGAVGFGDADHYLTLSSSNPVRVWASNDFDGYNRSGNEYEITIGGTQRFLLSAVRGQFSGNLIVSGSGGATGVNLPHAAGYFTVAGAAVTGQRAFNVSSISYVSAGVYDVEFTTAAANSTYIVQLALQATGNASAGVAWFTNLATTGFRIGVTDNNADSSFDPAGVSFVVIPGA